MSWLVHSDSYEVFFNRDEQKSRSPATPPQLLTQANNRSLMPIDPEGGGSWLATTEYGQVIALLNLYQADTTIASQEQQSRGLLVRQLASFSGWKTQQQWLDQLKLKLYRPFTLFIFTPTWNQQHQLVDLDTQQLDWDNNRFSQQKTEQCFFSSSSVATQAVLANRQNCYNSLIPVAQPATDKILFAPPSAQPNLTTADLLKLHQSHQPNASAYSICMHREDAQTVSFSHIKVSQQNSQFDYYPNSPCQSAKCHSFSLKNKQN